MKDIKFKDYILLKDKSDYNVLEHIKGDRKIKWFIGNDLQNLSYGQVMQLKRFQGNYDDVIKMFNFVFDMKAINVLNMSIVDYFKGLNYFIDEMNVLIDKENSMFSSNGGKVAQQWSNAQNTLGINLSSFAEMNLISNMLETYGGYTYDTIEKETYSTVITDMYYRAQRSKVEVKYQEISAKK